MILLYVRDPVFYATRASRVLSAAELLVPKNPLMGRVVGGSLPPPPAFKNLVKVNIVFKTGKQGGEGTPQLKRPNTLEFLLRSVIVNIE